MYVRISDLAIGQNGADQFLARVQTDVIPLYRGADGFIAYYAIEQSTDSVTTVRVFEDEASLDAAVQASQTVSDQITSDFQVTATPHGGADATVAYAFAPVHT